MGLRAIGALSTRAPIPERPEKDSGSEVTNVPRDFVTRRWSQSPSFPGKGQKVPGFFGLVTKGGR